MFKKPAVGSKVFVKTEYKFGYTKIHESVGVVVASARYDDADSFRLATGKPSFPISVISLDNVIELKYDDGSSAETVNRPKIEVMAWEVPSDSRKGDTYTVTKEGNHYNCSCVGFSFRKSCRHINKVKEAA